MMETAARPVKAQSRTWQAKEGGTGYVREAHDLDAEELGIRAYHCESKSYPADAARAASLQKAARAQKTP